jgi:hypothetical protein
MVDWLAVDVTEDVIKEVARRVVESKITPVVIDELVDAIAITIINKNTDYGDAWQRWGIFTPLVRINDKIMRVQTLASGQRALVADEKIEDTLQDIVAYGLLALAWLNRNK